MNRSYHLSRVLNTSVFNTLLILTRFACRAAEIRTRTKTTQTSRATVTLQPAMYTYLTFIFYTILYLFQQKLA